MADLKQQLIKLGSKRKDLRPHIRPVLDAMKDKTAEEDFNPYSVIFDPRMMAFRIKLGRGLGAGATLTIHLDGRTEAKLSAGKDVTVDLSR